MQVALAEEYMNKVFVPRAASGGASEVVATILQSDPDGSRSIARAICKHVEERNADALVLMRQRKSSINRILLGSVTEYSAKHSRKPVIIVPP